MLHNIIEKYKNLQKIAWANQQAIERRYRYDDNGYVVNQPMNVGDREQGHSRCPYHKNAYIIARHYYRFAYADILDDKALQEFYEFFCDTTTTIEESKDELILDQFVNPLKLFHENLMEYHHLFSVLKKDPTSNEISFCAMLENQAKFLCEKNYSFQMVIDAAKNVLAKMSDNTFDVFLKFDKPAAISIEKIMEINKHFDSFKDSFIPRLVAVRKSDAENNCISDDEKIQKLSNYLMILSCPLRVKQFKKIFESCQYNMHFSNDSMQVLSNYWKKMPFFSQDLQRHQTLLAPVHEELKSLKK